MEVRFISNDVIEMGVEGNGHGILYVIKYEGRNSLEDLGVDGKILLK
jgi:hypothetical protein